MLLTDAKEVKAVCARMAAHSYITVDTEFLRETTFWPKLCLVQLASNEDAVAIDALAEGMDLTPLYDLMRNPSVLKVFHAARQDLEIFWKAMGELPAPVFDTQVAAMVLGHGDQVGYEALVQRIVGVPLDKTSRVTDWTRRPLSEAQCAYAIADVTHLRLIYDRLSQELKKRGRAEWMKEEMATLTSVATYAQEPARAWERYAGRVRKPRDLAVLMKLSAWREAEAQARDVPRSRVVKDDTMFDIAMSAPKSVEALGNIRSVPKGWERSRDGLKIVDLVNEALAIDPKSLPPIERHRPPTHSQSATVELLKVLLKMIAEKHHVSAKIIASSDDLDKIAEQDEADIGALKGWRRELFGDKALALKAGKVALALEKGRVALVERPTDEAPRS